MNRLSKHERETIITTTEADSGYVIYTHQKKLRHSLERFSEQYQDLCRLETADENGAVTYIVDKSRVSIRLIPPYSEERKRQAAESVNRLNGKT